MCEFEYHQHDNNTGRYFSKLSQIVRGSLAFRHFDAFKAHVKENKG